MYKKKQFLKIAKRYNSYQDVGTVGTMMKMCHEKLEDNRYLEKLNKLVTISFKTKRKVIELSKKVNKFQSIAIWGNVASKGTRELDPYRC